MQWLDFISNTGVWLLKDTITILGGIICECPNGRIAEENIISKIIWKWF